MAHSLADPVAAAARRLRSRKIVAIAALIVASSGAAALAATITPQSVSPSKHLADCAAALWSDPEAHALYCGPGTAVPRDGNDDFKSADLPPPEPSSSSEPPA